jgi:alpha-beta hydrolase superfamily lysophospholipase
MFRGYVDQKLYSTGTGSRPAASYFAKNGYMTIAPDFLGYGGSDSESGNIFETRFQTYTTAISLLKAIEQMKSDKTVLSVSNAIENPSRISTRFSTFEYLNLWAHSNGGQIALTTLEVTKSSYPTTLWAPVTKGFPYSVLYYTDESDDGGKFIRKEISKLENIYDVDNYSLSNYIENINAPLQFHQGGEDDAIPMEWTDEFVYRLKTLGKEVTYWKYQSADHNMRPNWDLVVERDLNFFKTEHEKKQ